MSETRCANCMRKLADKRGPCPHCGFDNARYRSPDDALPPGSLINNGKYAIGRVLGRGGFGITYVALDRNLELRVAVKECLPTYAARRDPFGTSVQWGASEPEQRRAMENFLREARKMAKIDRIPGVVLARDCFEDNNTAYIVMDYVEGETLLQRLQRAGRMSAEECFRILSPAMDSLAQIHKLRVEGKGLVHRDITPGNIMIERVKDGEQTWVLDLGAAKELGERASAPNVSAFTQMVGTPGFAPLEQYTPDGRIGPWTDVYSLSAVFFYAVTGATPPPSTSRALEAQPPDVLRSVPGPLGDVLRKGMALRPEERYQSMEELRDALKEAIYPPPPPPTPTPPPPSPSPAPAPKNKLLIPLVALALLALIPAAILFGSKSGPEPTPRKDDGLLDAGQTEDAETLWKRGIDYCWGNNGVEQDYAKARELWEQAAAQGHAGALYDLGVLYERGNGVPQDYAKARDYYEQAAAQGHASALCNLGVFYENGYGGLQQDYAKAREYYEQAAEKGDAQALHNLGVFYENGHQFPSFWAHISPSKSPLFGRE